ncbi:hypothetical protein HID58_025073 [Brassica napus]|uniref:Uncharacterized protein n=1 Tax=Brassica napus TaxID=3708 RepID=A0ABQ8CK05_BRANA|nr:hypothetical protein HID58_025073 [Brassica napus]
MVTLSDEYSDSQATKTAETGDGGGIEEKHTPWSKGPPTEPAPPLPAVDGVVSITIPDEILADPNPLWRCYVVVGSESSEVEINGDGKVRYELAAKRNVVSELLLELEGLPPALGSDVIGDATRKVFEIGGSSDQINGDAFAAESQQEWTLVGGKSPTSSAVGKQRGLKQNGEVNVEDDGIISPSRFSVLATK